MYSRSLIFIQYAFVALSIPDHRKERVPSHRLSRAESAAAAAAAAAVIVVVRRRGFPGSAGEDGVVAEEAQRDDAPRTLQR